MANQPASIVEDESPLCPPKWTSLESVRRASLQVYCQLGNFCVTGVLCLQRFGPSQLFRIAFDGFDTQNGEVNQENPKKGTVYLSTDVESWEITYERDDPRKATDTQNINVVFTPGLFGVDGISWIRITIPVSDDNDDTFFTALLSADEERRRITRNH